MSHDLQDNPRNFGNIENGLRRYGYAVCGYCGRNMHLKYVKSNGNYRYFCGPTPTCVRAHCVRPPCRRATHMYRRAR
jgi:hypothetical protein